VIIVAGGSGRLGQLIVTDLLARGEHVRVLVRDTERARALLGSGVEVLAGDVRRAAELRPLVDGASVVISAMHGFLGGRGAGPDEVDRLGNANLVNAAQAADAAVVLVSVLGAEADSRAELFRAKHAAEQQLRASGAAWTIVRAGPFLETWLGILTQTAGKSGRPLIFGRGAQPIPFVSAEDVAVVVSAAATDPALAGRILEVTGRPITMNEFASALQAARGWQGSARHLPRPVLRAFSMLARPINPAFARQNGTALVMDTAVLAADPAQSIALGSPRRTLTDVLNG
jgi:NADH dehydrogenase